MLETRHDHAHRLEVVLMCMTTLVAKDNGSARPGGKLEHELAMAKRFQLAK